LLGYSFRGQVGTSQKNVRTQSRNPYSAVWESVFLNINVCMYYLCYKKIGLQKCEYLEHISVLSGSFIPLKQAGQVIYAYVLAFPTILKRVSPNCGIWAGSARVAQHLGDRPACADSDGGCASREIHTKNIETWAACVEPGETQRIP
jgi:hypothetical protein